MSELNPKIIKFFNSVNDLIRETFLKNGSLNEVICFLLDGDRIHQIPIPVIGNKNDISHLLRLATAHIKPSALVFASEAWVVAKPLDGMISSEANKKFNNLQVSEDPDKTECIVLINETKLTSYSVTIPIVRDHTGKPSLGDQVRVSNPTGRFCNLLYDHGKAVN